MSSVSSDITYLVMETRFSDTNRLKEFPTAHVQVKRMSDGPHVIYGILNVVNVVRHYLVMERSKEGPTAHVQGKNVRRLM